VLLCGFVHLGRRRERRSAAFPGRRRGGFRHGQL